MKRHAGFTIIELLVCVAMLALLAVVVLPRFTSMVGDARQAGFESVLGSFETSVRIAHSGWIAEGAPGATQIMLGGQTVEMNADGWPRIDGSVPAQDTAAELYSRLMTLPVPDDWGSTEDTTAMTADYTYNDMTFRYDANTGVVLQTAP